MNEALNNTITIEDITILYLSLINVAMIVGRWLQGVCPAGANALEKAFCNAMHPGLPVDATMPAVFSLLLWEIMFISSSFKILLVAWLMHLVPIVILSIEASNISVGESVTSVCISNAGLLLVLYMLMKVKHINNNTQTTDTAGDTSILNAIVVENDNAIENTDNQNRSIQIDLKVLYGLVDEGPVKVFDRTGVESIWQSSVSGDDASAISSLTDDSDFPSNNSDFGSWSGYLQ